MRKTLWILCLGLLSVVVLAACGSDTAEQQDTKEEKEVETETPEMKAGPSGGDIDPDAPHPEVTMTLESGDVVTMELYPEVAPNTVHNFLALVEDGFYDGLIFHRVIPGFMVQGGDPEGTGMGGPDYEIPGEFASNGFTNNIAHETGVLSMARSQSPDSAGSQFFIMVNDAAHLDEDYAAFGKVTDGMDAVQEIVQVETGANDQPKEDQVIQSMTADLKGYEVEDVIKQ